jgi:hypothetical protein
MFIQQPTMNSKTLLIATAIILAATIQLRAAAISQWTFDGAVQTAASVDPNATASSFTLSSGGLTFPAGNPNTGEAISGNAWRVADGVKWWEFTVSAEPGYLLNLNSLTFDDQRSTTGPTLWSVVVNGATVSSSQATHTTISSGHDSVDLSTAAFQGLSSGVVKIFGFNGTGTSDSGTWRLDNVILNGTLTPIQSVPETLPFGFTAFFVLGFLAIAHKIGGSKQPAPAKAG